MVSRTILFQVYVQIFTLKMVLLEGEDILCGCQKLKSVRGSVESSFSSSRLLSASRQ